MSWASNNIPVLILVLVTLGAGVFALMRLVQGQAGRETRQRKLSGKEMRRLVALRQSDDLLANDVEGYVRMGHELSAPAASRDGGALIRRLSEFRAEGADLRLRLLEESRQRSLELAEAGVNLVETLAALDRSTSAVQDLYAAAIRLQGDALKGEPELLAEQMRAMDQALGQLEASVRAKRAQLQGSLDPHRRVAA
jgi:hypothetical protein